MSKLADQYLYKCMDCDVVKAVEEHLGEKTWCIYCRMCKTVSEHRFVRIAVMDNGEEIDDTEKGDKKDPDVT